MARQVLEGFRANRIEGDGAGRRVIGIGPHQQLKPRLEGRPLFHAERRVIRGARCLSPAVEDEHAFAMQPVGRPIGRHVRSVTPDGANLLAADRLPDALSVLNVPAVEYDRPSSRHDLRRNGGRVREDLDPHSAQHGERDGQHQPQRDPQFLVVHAGYLSWGTAPLVYRPRRAPQYGRSISIARGNRMLFSRWMCWCRSASNSASARYRV